MMQLIEGGPVYDAWRAPTLPTYTSMYLWNVTNPDEVVRLGAKPHLQEVGPYVFEETVEKVNISHHHDNGTLSYTRKRFWYHIPEFSAASLDDTITTINFPAMVSESRKKYRRGIQSMYIKKERGVPILGHHIYDWHSDEFIRFENDHHEKHTFTV